MQAVNQQAERIGAFPVVRKTGTSELSNEELLQLGKERADNNILSEAYCLEIAQRWYEAAETARIRRTVPKRKPDLWDDSLKDAN